MEISEYWSQTGRKRWLLLVLPVIAGAAAAGFGLSEPPEYEGVTVVRVPVTDGAAETPSTARQVISQFEAVVGSGEFALEFAEEMDVPRAGSSSRVHVSQIGSGLVVQLRYRASSEERAVEGSAIAGRLAVELYFAPRVAEAEAFRDAADRYRREAEAALERFVADAGVGQPVVSYNAILRVLEDLRVRGAMAEADGNAGALAGLKPIIQRWEQRAADAGVLSRRYETLEQERNRADDLVATGEQRVATTRSMHALARDDSVVVTGPAQRASMRSTMTQLIGGAMVLGALLAALVLFAWEYLSQGRRQVVAAVVQPDRRAPQHAVAEQWQ